MMRGFKLRSVAVIVAGMVICASVFAHALVRRNDAVNEELAQSSEWAGLPFAASRSMAPIDFPNLGQTARFGDLNNDRQGYGAAAYGNHLAYVLNQGIPGGADDGAVALESFAGSYIKGSADTAAWSGNIDYVGGTPAGTVVLKPPVGSGASGFGYGLAMNEKYVFVCAKWSQQVFVYDLSGRPVRVIAKPTDGPRYKIDNFAESIALNGDTLLIGAPNSTVDGMEDAGMAFSLDLSLRTSLPEPLLAPQGDLSIQEGALVGQTVALSSHKYAIGAPGYVTTSSGKNYITGLVQLFSAKASWRRDLTVNMNEGSYPGADDGSVAGLGRSLAFSNDGTKLYAGDPSYDPASVWGSQVGHVMTFDTESGTAGGDISVDGGRYIGGSLGVGQSAAGTDALYVSYQSSDGSVGYLAGYAVTSKGIERRQTLSPFNAHDSRFGSLGLLGGAIVPYSFTSDTNVAGASEKIVHQRLLVTGQDFVYNFEDQLPLELEKVSDPAPGTRVFPGQEISYTLKIRNPNPKTSPVVTSISDDLSGVLDYAEEGRLSDLGVDSEGANAPTFDQAGKRLKWSGSVAGGSSLNIAYRIKVKKSQNPDYYRGSIKNRFNSDRSADEPSTEHELGKIDVNKTIFDKKDVSLPSGTALGRDQDYSYQLTIANHTDTDAPLTTVIDDLSAVIDDADFNAADLSVSPAMGNIAYDPTTHKLTWSGALKSSGMVKISVPIHTHKSGEVRGNDTMENALVNDRGPDSGRLTSPLKDIQLDKQAQNDVGMDVSSAARGKSIHYKVTYVNKTGATLYNASIVDDLSNVLMNAKAPTGLKASSSDAGHAVSQPTFTNPDLKWHDTSGIKPGETITITYEVEVKAGAERGDCLINSVTSTQSSDRPTKSVKIIVPVSNLPMSGGRLIAMVLLVLAGVGLVIVAVGIRRSRQEV